MNIAMPMTAWLLCCVMSAGLGFDCFVRFAAVGAGACRTGEVEELNLQEIANEGHMSLIEPM